MSTDQKSFGGKLKRLFLEGEEPAPGELAEEPAPAAGPPSKASRTVDPFAHATSSGPDRVGGPGPDSANAPGPDRAATAAASAGLEPAKLDFPAVFRAAGLADEDLEQVDRAEQLVKTLPANLPLETKRQILEGTLQAFKVNPAKIRQSIQRQQRALAAYATVVRQDSDKRDAEAHARVETLRAEAMKLERSIEERARATASVELACRAQSELVGRAVEFLPEAKAIEKDTK